MSELTNYIEIFKAIQKTGDGALEQLTLPEMLESPDPESNSISVLIQHLHGNMLSRWTDFPEADGEKPWRDRDGEFDPRAFTTREEVLKLWNIGWMTLFQALERLQDGDLERQTLIRAQPHTIRQAILRQIYHYSYHVGQLVLLARMKRGSQWKTLSIAKGKSASYTPQGNHGEPNP